MLDEQTIKRVDDFGEELTNRLQAELRKWLQAIGIQGQLLEELSLKKAPKSDYWSAKVRGFDTHGNPKCVEKNFLQLNGHTYHHPSYRSPQAWKLLARFSSPPSSPLWEKKPPYIYNRQPKEWSLGGSDVWGISYESFAGALSKRSEKDIMDEIMEDLRTSWNYAFGIQLHPDFVTGGTEGPDNGGEQQLLQLAQDSTNIVRANEEDNVNITLSVDKEILSEFRAIVYQQYRSRRKHPKRPSYAQLFRDAVSSALIAYVSQWKDLGQDEDQASEARRMDNLN